MSSENNFAGSFFLIIIIKANVNTQPFADSSCLSWKNEGEHLKQRHQLTESINHSFFQNEYITCIYIISSYIIVKPCLSSKPYGTFFSAELQEKIIVMIAEFLSLL